MKKNYILVLFMIIAFLSACVKETPDVGPDPIDVEKTIAYIPLDDRPVNTTRAIYLSSSAGFELLMPDKDLYQTKLDGQPLNKNNTQHGDMEKLIEWVETIDASYYVISLDQVLSGGLVNSRIMNENNMEKTFDYIDRLFNCFEGKKVVLFDTVMRLASTVGYNGYQTDEYNKLRNYGSLSRKKLIGNYSINDILLSYNLDENGNEITSNISSNIIDEYLNARFRKISIASYVLDKLKNNQDIYIYFGIDDSSPKETIQTNEINYIKNNITNGTIFAGTDELGLMSITRVIKMHFDINGVKNLKSKVSYFGDAQNKPADDYDIGTLEENVNSHLTSLNVEIVDEDYDFEVLVLTKPMSFRDQNSHINLIKKLKENTNNHIPIIVIDASSTSHYGTLESEIIADEEVNLAYVLGYSNWNTVGNAIGIALSNGITRYLYLKYENNKTTEANEGFIKTLVFSFVKDISYKIALQGQIKNYIQSHVGSTNNFYSSDIDVKEIGNECLKILNNEANNLSAIKILSRFKGAKYISDLMIYDEKSIDDVNISEVVFPWYRTFEIDFTIEIIK